MNYNHIIIEYQLIARDVSKNSNSGGNKLNEFHKHSEGAAVIFIFLKFNLNVKLNYEFINEHFELIRTSSFPFISLINKRMFFRILSTNFFIHLTFSNEKLSNTFSLLNLL